MELKRVFGTDMIPGEQNAAQLWEITNERFKSDDCSALGFFKMFNVEYAAPCRTITESVSELEAIPAAAPSMRADGILPLAKEFISALEAVSEMKITDLNTFSEAVKRRIDSFDKAGCRFCDHALDHGFAYMCDDGKNEKRFRSVINGEVLSRNDEVCLSSHILRILAREYAERKWVMQLHIGAMRRTSAKKRAAYLAPAGIRVNAIAPGFFVNERSIKFLETPETGLSPRGQKVIDHTPMGRFGNAGDLLGCMRWLLDDRASAFVTGITVAIDGGFLTRSGV